MKDGSVVVLCQGPDAKKLFLSIKKLQTDKEYQFRECTMAPYFTDELFEDFKVERADDQTEMVLALKGAGYRFQKSTEMLHEIHQDLIKRDKRLEGARLLALHYELVYNLEQLANPQERRRTISTTALTANIQFPPTLVSSMVFPISTALISLQELRDNEHLFNNPQRVRQLREDVESLDRKIISALRHKYDINRV